MTYSDLLTGEVLAWVLLIAMLGFWGQAIYFQCWWESAMRDAERYMSCHCWGVGGARPDGPAGEHARWCPVYLNMHKD